MVEGGHFNKLTQKPLFKRGFWDAGIEVGIFSVEKGKFGGFVIEREDLRMQDQLFFQPVGLVQDANGLKYIHGMLYLALSG